MILPLSLKSSGDMMACTNDDEVSGFEERGKRDECGVPRRNFAQGNRSPEATEAHRDDDQTARLETYFAIVSTR